MGDGLGSILAWPVTPLWATFLVICVAAWRVVPLVMARINEGRRDHASAADALLARYEHRVAALEAAEEKCRHELADAISRVAALEGYNLGAGRASQEAQLIVSADREARKDRGK